MFSVLDEEKVKLNYGQCSDKDHKNAIIGGIFPQKMHKSPLNLIKILMSKC